MHTPVITYFFINTQKDNIFLSVKYINTYNWTIVLIVELALICSSSDANKVTFIPFFPSVYGIWYEI